MNHTPGPWRHSQDKYGVNVIRDAHDNSIMDDTSYYPSVDLTPADWTLVAAAPELLAALKAQDAALNQCLRYFLGRGPQPKPDDLASVVLQVSAAIAKAEGRST